MWLQGGDGSREETGCPLPIGQFVYPMSLSPVSGVTVERPGAAAMPHLRR
jgi:hypothetical protein